MVADQFVVTFDGRLYELPGSCPLLLARDVAPDPSFTLLLGADSESFLLVHMNNRTVDIQRNGDVRKCLVAWAAVTSAELQLRFQNGCQRCHKAVFYSEWHQKHVKPVVSEEM